MLFMLEHSVLKYALMLLFLVQEEVEMASSFYEY